MHNRKALAFVFSIMLLAAGCGGGDDTGLPPAGGDTGGPAYDPSTATATLTGDILFEGTPPEMPRLQTSSDPFCVRNASDLRSQEVLVTDDEKLQNVIVYIRSGHEGPSYPTPEEPIVLDQMGCRYAPHVFTIMTNQPLQIRNSDDTLHNIHMRPMVNRVVNFGQPVQGMENTQTLPQAEEPFPIRCDVHRWMSSYAAVFDHPFHTTSGGSGSYSIDLPPGSYEVVAWHEKYGQMVETIEVGDGETQLDFTFMEMEEGSAD